MADGEDAPMYPVESPFLRPDPKRGASVAELQHLTRGNHTVLLLRLISERSSIGRSSLG